MTVLNIKEALKRPPSQTAIDWVLSQAEASAIFDWALSQDPEMIIANLVARPRLWRAVGEQAVGDMQVFVDQARADMQEACAVVADEWALHYPTSVFPEDGTSVDCKSASAMRHASERIAAAIRASGTDE